MSCSRIMWKITNLFVSCSKNMWKITNLVWNLNPKLPDSSHRLAPPNPPHYATTRSLMIIPFNYSPFNYSQPPRCNHTTTCSKAKSLREIYENGYCSCPIFEKKKIVYFYLHKWPPYKFMDKNVSWPKFTTIFFCLFQT